MLHIKYFKDVGKVAYTDFWVWNVPWQSRPDYFTLRIICKL